MPTSPPSSTSYTQPASKSSDADLRALLATLGDDDTDGGDHQDGRTRRGEGGPMRDPMDDFLDLGMCDEVEPPTPSFSNFLLSPSPHPSLPSSYDQDPDLNDHPASISDSTTSPSSSSYPQTPHTHASVDPIGQDKEGPLLGGDAQFGSPEWSGLGEGYSYLAAGAGVEFDGKSGRERSGGQSLETDPSDHRSGPFASRAGPSTSTGPTAASSSSVSPAQRTYSLMGDIAYETVDFASMGGMGMGGGDGLFAGLDARGGSGLATIGEVGGRRGTINPVDLTGVTLPSIGGQPHHTLDRTGGRANGDLSTLTSDAARQRAQKSEEMERARALVAERMKAIGQVAQEQQQRKKSREEVASLQSQQQPQAQAQTQDQQSLHYADFLAALFKATQAQLAAANASNGGMMTMDGTALLQSGPDGPSPFYNALHPNSTMASQSGSAEAGTFVQGTGGDLDLGFQASNELGNGMLDFGLPLSPPYYDSASNDSYGMDGASALAGPDAGGRSSFSGSQRLAGMSPFSLGAPGEVASDVGMDEGEEEQDDEEVGDEDEQEELVQVKEEPMDIIQPTSRSHSSDARFQSETPSHAESVLDLSSIAARPLPAQFGGVKGKGGKKGGGVSSVVLANDEDADEGDDWRPSPEEYKKLSSKEKRQLRNKLSARAFRNRRKGYVNELEDHIKDRDRLIDAIRTELNSSKSENDELRHEINALKKAAMIPTPASLQKLTPRPSAANANAEAGPSNYAARASSRTSSGSLNMFNPNKDVSTSVFGALSPRAVKGFWNGAGGAFGAGNEAPGGGFTSVHTALTPDLRLPISPPMDAGKQPPISFTRVNLNPLINSSSSSPTGLPHQQLPKYSDAVDLTDSFEHWSNDNMFSHKTLDSYRMQIWSRMARQAALDRAGVAQDARPMFLRDSTTVTKPEGSGSPPDEHKPLLSRSFTVETLEVKPDISDIPPHIDQSAISSRLFAAFMLAFKSSVGKDSDDRKVAAAVATVASEKLSPAPLSSRGLSVLDADAALAASFASLNMATESLGLKAHTLASPVQERRPVLAFLGRA